MSATGYLVVPDAGRGRAALVLGSWWGLGDPQRAICDALADAGYVTLAPDLVGDARTTDDREVARPGSPNATPTWSRTSSCRQRRSSAAPTRPPTCRSGCWDSGWGRPGGCGWRRVRPTEVGALSFFYGTQRVDNLDVTAAVQGHFAEHDDLVDDDDRVLLEAALHLDGTDVEFFDYPGTSAGFFEHGPTYDEAAAKLAFERTRRFFDDHLGR